MKDFKRIGYAFLSTDEERFEFKCNQLNIENTINNRKEWELKCGCYYPPRGGLIGRLCNWCQSKKSETNQKR